MKAEETKLPKRFVILRDADNPLWDKYIKWLNGYCDTDFDGDNPSYYGSDNRLARLIEPFENHLTNYAILTPEQWDAIVNPKELSCANEQPKSLIEQDLSEQYKQVGFSSAMQSHMIVANILHNLLIKHKIFVEVKPVDDWNWWCYQILAEDMMSPFFVAHSSNIDDEFKSKLEAELHAIKYIFDNFTLTNSTKE